MPRRRIMPHKAQDQAGFTLLELLVVLAVLTAVAGIGVLALGNVTGDTRERLARAEMNEIANAIRRFRADTGYWPKDGIFAGEDDANLDNPANLSQLRVEPLDSSSTKIMEYDTATGSGWDGPYLRELDAVTVTAGADLQTDGKGDPTLGAEDDVDGVGDPFEASPVGNYFLWTDGKGNNPRLGRPYLYFIDEDAEDDGADGVIGCQPPCLVSLGPNGEYESDVDAGDTGGDDIVINIRGD